jgi:hypothetical protein
MRAEAAKAAVLALEEPRQHESHGRADTKRTRPGGVVLSTRWRKSSAASCKEWKSGNGATGHLVMREPRCWQVIARLHNPARMSRMLLSEVKVRKSLLILSLC